MIEQYLMITNGKMPKQYNGPEEEARKLMENSMFKGVSLRYSYNIKPYEDFKPGEIRIMP